MTSGRQSGTFGEECHLVAGNFDYLIKAVQDMAHTVSFWEADDAVTGGAGEYQLPGDGSAPHTQDRNHPLIHHKSRRTSHYGRICDEKCH